MAIKRNYSETTKCMSCGSTDLEVVHSSAGLEYCTCKLCGKKFIVQSEGVDLIDQYMSARSQVFKELEMMQFKQASSEKIEQELENIVVSFAVLAEIDTIYYWYKIILLTKNFTDYSRLKETQKEYLKIPRGKCYFITLDDIVRSEKYEKQYNAFISQHEEERSNDVAKKQKKKKAVAGTVLTLLAVLIIGAMLFTFLYNPIISDNQSNIFAQSSIKAFGVFGKFNVKLQVDELKEGSEGFEQIEQIIGQYCNVYKTYDLKLVQNGKEFKPKDKYYITMPVPDGFRKDLLVVYIINDDFSVSQIEGEFSNIDNTYKFCIESNGVIAIAEKMFTVEFDANGGEEISQKRVEYGEKIILPLAQREGYTFVGWYKEGSEFDGNNAITEDLSLVARWTANTYTIRYYFDNELLHTQNVVFDSEYQLYRVDRRGYVEEYSDGETKYQNGEWKTPRDVDMIITLKPVQITITFSNGDRVDDVRFTATYDGDMPVIEVPYWKGYVFGGYYEGQNFSKCIYGEDGVCKLAISEYAEDITLYAKWEKLSQYESYTYIETVEDLNQLRSLPNGKYLLLNDIDMQGATWSPINDFSGVFDGNGHSIYNFKIVDGIKVKTTVRIGFIGYLTGTIKNLQIGKEGKLQTTITYKGEHLRGYAGMVVGRTEKGAVIENCRAINCSIDIYTHAADSDYLGWDWITMAGGIVGYAYGAKVQKCYVTECDIKCEAATIYNDIKAQPQTGGIIGHADTGTIVEDCLVRDTRLLATATAQSGGFVTAGSPDPRCGGIIGYAADTTITRCISASNNILAIKNGSGGKAQYGTMVGQTSATSPSNLYKINMESKWYSGSNADYGGCGELSADSYDVLISTNEAFKNDCWISGKNGDINLKFDEFV
ncbi:MAG: InlB B-repeat-containing protein [Clostridia bacterium]|nr:InlB B-repeat-containing protein [Clostridia bacterium]